MSAPKSACVIGWPIRHSRSPIIHNYWLRQHAITGSYDKREVAPDDLAGFLGEVAAGAYAGCNVTVPHKERVFGLLDQVDATAEAVGAVNTIWADRGQLFGSNTDVEGFLASLDDQTPDWGTAPLRAVVLGAGGAARAVVFGLKKRGAEVIHVVNRSPQRAEHLAREFGRPVEAAAWSDLARLIPDATLLVNATSLGMAGAEPLALAHELPHLLSPETVVADIVYVPLRTELLTLAERRGCRTADGLGMLLHQAVPGFEKWFGVRPAVTPELRRLVEDDLLARSPT